MRMWQGASGASSYEGIVSPAYTVIYPNHNTRENIIFWAYYFKDPDLIKLFQKHSQGLTSDTWNLKFNQLSNIFVAHPSYDEQCKIANCLERIDLLVQSEELKLEQILKVKRSLLQQMFI